MNISDKVYSSSSEHASGKWYPSAANFPACKLLLHQNDIVNGATTWTDRISQLVITNTTGFVKDANGVVPAAGGAQTITGPLPAMGTKQFVLMASGMFNASNAIEIGDLGSGPGIGMKTGGGEYIIRDGSNYIASAAVGTPPSFTLNGCLSLHADTSASNEARKTWASQDGTESTSAVAGAKTGTIAGNWTAFPNIIVLPTNAGASNMRFTIIALFAFTNAPSAPEVVIATKWMAANPGKLYPRWAGVS